MRIEIAEHSRMTESGSSLLRLIQNQDIPLLDLLVRESVQNSLDAAAELSGSVGVDMLVGEFVPRALNRNFEKIEDALNRRFHRGNEKFIAVRDSNTVGLTGPIRYKEVKNNVFGNLLKLVYEICKPQSNEGAGGSWGLGKTIYFRLGIGLVIYYSRIYQNGRYQSRLAACLVENETKSEAMIPYNGGVKRGIAWWGKRESFGSNATVPLEDEQEIKKILSVFGIDPYQKKETGTTIIIPYVNEKLLLDEVYAKNEAAENRPYWANSISEYLKVALQRWYAPRLNNEAYPYGAYLSACINHHKIKVSEMLPLFRYIRELYILATREELNDESFIRENNVEVHSESINLRGVLTTTSAGKFTYAKMDRKQLMMDPPANHKTPYQQVLNAALQMEGGNGPIMGYTRKPGMIVRYDYDGTWTHRMPKTNPDEYIIGLFVANSENTLKDVIDPITEKKMTLEEYIRQGEKADHASWTDRNIAGNNPRIVSNIQKNVINKVKKEYSEPIKDVYVKQNIGLGHALANILLPDSDFGATADLPKTPPKKKESHHTRSGKKSAFRVVGAPRYSSGKVVLDFEICLKDKPCVLSLQVLTDFKHYHADAWESEEEIGKEFPVKFQEMKVNEIHTGSKSSDCHSITDFIINDECAQRENKYLSATFCLSERYRTRSYIEFRPDGMGCVANGSLTFVFRDPGLKATCDLKELSNE